MVSFKQCFDLSASTRAILIVILLVVLQFTIINGQYSNHQLQRFDLLQQPVEKLIQKQQFPYMRENYKASNRRSANNREIQFINIPSSNEDETVGALLSISLLQYHNPNLTLPNGYTCACPQESKCPYLQEGILTCSFSFTIIISTPNQSARFIESPFVLVSKTPIDSGVWTNENRLNMSVKPNAVDIIVHHLGVVIDKATGNLEYLNHLTIIDTFTISLRDYQATVYGTSPNIVKKSIRGQILGTSLQVVYSVQCIGDKNGPSCDLVCAPAPSNKRCAACVSTLTGMQISCKYLGSSITNCIPCPLNLTKDGTECVTPRIDQTEQDLVSSVFRIWTIVLGCLLGIAILLIIFLVIIFAIIQKREKAWRRSRQYAGMTYSIEPSRAFLSQENDEWHRSKIKATISGSRTETTEEPTEDEYVRSGVVPVIRREAHV